MVSAFFIIESAVIIARATMVAFGTSLPRLFIDIRAFLKGHSALAFGDVVGSGFVNLTLILGITLLIPALVGSPLTMNMQVFQDLVVFSLIATLFLWYFLSLGRLSWREGAILLFIYILFLATSLARFNYMYSQLRCLRYPRENERHLFSVMSVSSSAKNTVKDWN